MLSTLAKYIFGGFVEVAPETTPMQYETREVNDWLLVDMPDQDIDNEDLNSEGEEEDEILTALPLLMTQDSYICDNSYAEIHMPIEQSCSMDTQLATQSSFLSECLEDFQILPESLYLNQSLYYPADFSLVVSQCYNGFHCTTTRNPERSFFHAAIPKDRRKRIVTVKITPMPVLADKRINHPAYSKNFINHRSPVLPPKTALLEQIKDLKPVQKAVEHETKKYLTRSQLNRQNRNYIYETSVKTNRRRNLQRNHSGANNNRKCY